MREPFAPPDPASVRSVLVVHLYFLGDTLIATPALRALRERFPGARLEVLVKARSRAALAHNPRVDRVTVYDPPFALQRPFHWAGLARRWRAEGVDLAVDLTADRRSLRMLRLARPRTAVGYLRPDLPLPVAAGVDKPVGEGHVALHHLRLVALAGAEGLPVMEFFVPDAADAEARAWREDLPREAVALHPGSNRVLRRWKLPLWRELVRRLVDAGFHPWVLGGRDERPLGRELASAGAEDATGRLNLDRTAARLRHSRLLVANDSGPLHLAAAVGTPTLSLFGPSLPSNVAPLGPSHAYLHVRLDCCPCGQRRCVRPGDFCLDRITVDQVWERALAVLAARSREAR